MGNSRNPHRRQALGMLASSAWLSKASINAGDSAAPSASASVDTSSEPSLGNLFPQIASYAREITPAYSFLQPRFKELEDWKQESRQRMRERLFYEPPIADFRARVIERQQRKGYVQENLVFETAPNISVSAALLIPSRPLKNKPAVVALHDHGGFYFFGKEKMIELDNEPAILTDFKEKIYEGTSYASDFARAGFVVLAIDAFYFGTRRLQPGSLPADKITSLKGLKDGSTEYIEALNKLAGEYESLTAKTIFLAGATWPGFLLWDDARSVDYLMSRSEVNPERIGCVGLSLGGLRAAFLGGMHPRIRSTTICCFMSTFQEMLRNYVEHHTWMLYAAGMLEMLDLPDVASLTAPNWLFVQYGHRDILFPNDGKQKSAEKIGAIYSKAKCSNRFQASFYDAPHAFTRKMQTEAIEWFNRTLA